MGNEFISLIFILASLNRAKPVPTFIVQESLM